METQVFAADDPQGIQKALELLRSGQLVAFPTDTVYGLGGLVFDSNAIDRLYAVKGRDDSKAIPVLVGSVGDLGRVTSSMGALASRLAARFWPGPLTLVVARHPDLPGNLSPDPTVGVRMPDHPAALALLRLTGPMAVSSANLSNQPSASSAAEVLGQLEGRVPLILDGGRTPGGQPSTVVDCTGPELRVLRPGPITLEQLLAR
jgi:L-threonylcarbamoyladenylate synthase